MDRARPRRLLTVAAVTPADRDRYVDFLRGLSILVVVLGHWLIAVVTWKDGAIEGRSALEVIGGFWIATWVLQVMPLFFCVGGFSNLRSLRAAAPSGGGYASFLHGRMVRMLRPTIVFLTVGIGLGFLAIVWPLGGFVAEHLALDGAGSIAHVVAGAVAVTAAVMVRRRVPNRSPACPVS